MQNEQASSLEKLNKNSTNWNSLCFFFIANYDYFSLFFFWTREITSALTVINL